MHDAQLEAVNTMLSPFDLTTPSARECERLLCDKLPWQSICYQGQAALIGEHLNRTSTEAKQMKELEWLEALLEDSDAQARCPPAKLQNITEHVYRRYNEVRYDVSDEARIIEWQVAPLLEHVVRPRCQERECRSCTVFTNDSKDESSTSVSSNIIQGVRQLSTLD